jgi:two-component system, OmpR family, sensor histidine kinase KdpD
VKFKRLPQGEAFVAALASAGAVALVTAAIAVARPYVPVLSLGVLYVFAVLPVAVAWGLAYAIPVSIASMLAFNWLYLPPTHTFALRDSENWFALAVYLVTAVVVSELAARARRRAAEAEQREREAALLAQVADALLRGVEVAEELERLDAPLADVLGVVSARIELGQAREPAYPLSVGAREVGSVVVSSGRAPDPRVRERLLPALASLVAVAVDRAELQREALEAEALRRSDAAKTALLRAVSHDLRSPLTAIDAAASGLDSTSLHLRDEDRRALIATIREESARLGRLVENLLDLSRLEAGAAQPRPELWPAEELVAQALDELSEGDARVVLELDEDVPPVRVDAAQIERVLVNLIENALKYSPAEAPVHVSLEVADGEVRLHVIDRGPGIAASERDRLFEPFRRGADAGAGGAGLGLAIARGFAEANGGRVWAEPATGGAHLVVSLPAAEPAPVRA